MINNVSNSIPQKTKYIVQNKKTIQRQKENHTKQVSKDNNFWFYLAGSAAAVGGLYILTRGKTQNVEQTVQNTSSNASKYINDIVAGLKNCFKIDVKPQNLSCIMDKEEFLKAVSKLNKENYNASAENIANGIFKADLHSHSVFSDGCGTVANILDNVCDYANVLNKKTGDKFIFALTDHDSADGVKEALKIISQSPDKFKNVRFVIGSEISYLIKSDKTRNPTETSELLAYGFNPFSKNVSEFFEELKDRRLKTVKHYIKDLSEAFQNTKFSEEEYYNVFLADRVTHNPMMNMYWNLYHYGQIKTVLSDTAQAKGLNPEEYFKEIMSKAPKKPNLYKLKKAGLIENWINENPKITEINDRYRPEIDENGHIINKCENVLENIAKAFKNEENCSIGFSHPYYISERTSNVQNAIKEVHSKLGTLLQLSENYHQAYSPELIEKNSKEIDNISKMCNSEKLIPIGGRDNHKAYFLEKALYEN